MTSKRRKRHSLEEVVRKLRNADAAERRRRSIGDAAEARSQRRHLPSLAEPVWRHEV